VSTRNISGIEAPLASGNQDTGRSDRFRLPAFILPVLLGALAFFFVTGGGILRPTNLGWLMGGDPGMDLLGWMFFRDTPFWQQPIGANWPFGMELGSALIYTDSLLLLAFPFKLFSGLLPPYFQYFGFWILICFCLQTVFGYQLAGRFSANRWHKTLSALFFVLAPSFLWRMQWHMMLAAHWLILAALCLYFSDRFRYFFWLVLLAVASLVTPILFAMVLLIFGAALLKAWLRKEQPLPWLIGSSLATGLILAIVMWEGGYFTVTDVGAGGFGDYRVSLAGFIDPSPGAPGEKAAWSALLPSLPKDNGNYEGFCFLGAGVLVLVGTAVFAFVKNRRSWIPKLAWRNRKLWFTVMPIGAVFIFSILFALSNNIGIGPHILVHYEIPGIIAREIAPFRASARFVWPAYYLIIAGLLAVTVRGFRTKTSSAILAGCLVLQVADSWHALRVVRHRYQTDLFHTSLSSPFWQQAADRYRKILYVFPSDAPPPYFALCYFAASHHRPINIGSWARFDEGKLEAARDKLVQVVRSGTWDPTALYVFETTGLWSSAVLRMKSDDWVGVVDGLPVLAPGWLQGQRQDPVQIWHQSLPTYVLGRPLSLTAASPGLQFLGYGWDDQDSQRRLGSWSIGNFASFNFQLSSTPTADLLLSLDALAVVNKRHPEQKVEVSVNSLPVGSFSYTRQDPQGRRTIRIPRELVVNRNNVVEIEFHLPDAVSSAMIGWSQRWDPRKLALQVKAVELSPAPNQLTGTL
jgi:Family of unknown function (DUF6311)